MSKLIEMENWVHEKFIQLSQKHHIKKEKITDIISDWHDLQDNELTFHTNNIIDPSSN